MRLLIAIAVFIVAILLMSAEARAHTIGCQVASQCDEGRAWSELQAVPVDHCKAIQDRGVPNSVVV
ncbi:hypothetical protein, partial [Stenotrophomonas sp. NPDC078853]|uniref:hypothetical protein n=1 Tax=Stenotrophomonas sp. NPDC078853 TaxID=3364534 RepID=UPI00384C1A73